MIRNSRPDRDLVHVPIKDLQIYLGNPRTHTPEQLKKAIASFREFGWTNPILIDENNVIIAGDLRRSMAEAVGLDEVPCIRIPDLSEAQKRALRIADNRIALDAGWDEDKLRLELEYLKESDLDLALTGFDNDELSALLRETPQSDPDDTPPEPAHPVSELGDVWILGDHRIICGDSTVPEVVTSCLAGSKPDLMVTDPPYGVEYDAAWRGRLEPAKRATGVVLTDDTADWSKAWDLFKGSACYVWHAGLHAGTVLDSLSKAGLILRSQIIWVKTKTPLGRGNYHWKHEAAWVAERNEGESASSAILREALARVAKGEKIDQKFVEAAVAENEAAGQYDAAHEVAVYGFRKGKSVKWLGGRSQSTVWEISHIKSGTGHSTQKPVECMRRPVENNSAPGDAVYEPFSGSGTTIIACEMTGRKCRAIELNPSYVDVAVTRWEIFTGKRAVHEASGLTMDKIAERRGAPMPERVIMKEKR